MTGERWTTLGNEAPPDPRRRHLFDDWCESGVVQFGVTFETYAQARLDGTWNEYARRFLSGRFTVEEER